MSATPSFRQASAATFRALVLSAVLVGAAQAAPITIQFSTTDARVNGVGAIDISIVFQTDTNSFQAGANPFGGGLYAGLTGRVTSVDLGLSNALVTNPLSIYVGLPGAGVPSAVAFADASGQLAGVFPVSWNGVSSISGANLGSTGTSPGPILTIGGTTYRISSLDATAGVNEPAFSATVVPEPETYALMLAGLGALGLALRRRRAQAIARQGRALP